ncbi:MAG: hypothetical protein AB7V25_12575 [Mangrovibacterium sp.]
MKKSLYLPAIALVLGLSAPQLVSAGSNRNETVISQDINYQEIPAGNLPETVTDALDKDYAGYTIDKAYLGDDGSYKLDVSQADIKYSIFYKENGELIKVEEPEGQDVKQNIEEGTEDIEEGVKEGTDDVEEGMDDAGNEIDDMQNDSIPMQ